MKGLANCQTRIFFVVVRNLLRRQIRGYWDRPVEIICMRRAQAGNSATRLRPCRRKFGMRMRDAAHARKLLIQNQVGRQVGRWTEPPLDYLARQIRHDQIFGRELLVRHAAGFDNNKTSLTLDCAGISKGVEDQSPTDQFEIGFTNLFSQLFKQHSGTGKTSSCKRSDTKKLLKTTESIASARHDLVNGCLDALSIIGTAMLQREFRSHCRGIAQD